MAGNHIQPIQDDPWNMPSTSTGSRSSLPPTPTDQVALIPSTAFPSNSATFGNSTVSTSAGSFDTLQIAHPQIEIPHWATEVPEYQRSTLLINLSSEIQSLQDEYDTLDKDLEKLKMGLMNLENIIAVASRAAFGELMEAASDLVISDHLQMCLTDLSLQIPMDEISDQLAVVLTQKLSAILEKQSELEEEMMSLAEIRELVPRMMKNLKEEISEQVNTTLSSAFLRLQEEAQKAQLGQSNFVPELFPHTDNDTASVEDAEDDLMDNGGDNELNGDSATGASASLPCSGPGPGVGASGGSGLDQLMNDYELMSEDEEAEAWTNWEWEGEDMN